MTAPVEQGTGDAELNVAVGHADSTPWPGTPGTSVFLAHDVSYFALIANLQPGDVINYEANCV
ncbi:MAG: sortase domain-containing protein, partial [Acidimicrobiales bacterium]